MTIKRIKVGIYIPKEINDKINSIVKNNGIKRKEIFDQALANFLKTKIEKPNPRKELYYENGKLVATIIK